MTFTMPKLLSSLLACLSLAATSAIAAEPAVNPNPTIRAMSGAVPIDRLDPASTALLVIDFQQEYFTGRLPIPDGQKALNKARELIAFADKARIPVYQIQHIAPAGSAVFALDGEGVKFHPQMLPRAGDTVLQKTTVSVFGSTELDRLLKEKGLSLSCRKRMPAVPRREIFARRRLLRQRGWKRRSLAASGLPGARATSRWTAPDWVVPGQTDQHRGRWRRQMQKAGLAWCQQN